MNTSDFIERYIEKYIFARINKDYKDTRNYRKDAIKIY